MKCDVIVVDAGPGRSMAAKIAAEAGLDMVLLEKRQENRRTCQMRCNQHGNYSAHHSHNTHLHPKHRFIKLR